VVDSPSIVLAFAAGLVSFASPCCLPLVPGYLAAVSGTEPDDLGRRLDPRVMTRSLMFVTTFSAIFILLGLSATALGNVLFENRLTLNKVAGATIIALGLFFIASLFVTRLNRDWRSQALIARAGRGSSGDVMTRSPRRFETRRRPARATGSGAARRKLTAWHASRALRHSFTSWRASSWMRSGVTTAR